MRKTKIQLNAQAERLNSEGPGNGMCDSLVCMKKKNMQRVAEMTTPGTVSAE